MKLSKVDYAFLRGLQLRTKARTGSLESLERGSKGYLHTTQTHALSHGAMAREGHAKVFIFINMYIKG